MRAEFTNETDHVLAFSDANQKRLETLAKAYGVTPNEFLQHGLSAMVEKGVLPPLKEGRVLPFEALKSNPRGTK